MAEVAAGQGLYLYAISRRVDEEDLTGRTGIADAPLRAVDVGDLTALVSVVDLGEFGEEGLRRNLEDLRWLEEVARAHDRVTRHAWQHATAVPVRLATVFRSEESLRTQLHGWRESADRALSEVEDREEWSVKVYAAGEVAAPAGSTADSAGARGSGTAYLMQRRAATQQREQRDRDLADAAERVHDQLRTETVASRRLAPQDARLTGREDRMLLNAAFLVDRAAAGAFRGRVEELAAQHPLVHLELGGPWPPYSFVTLETP